MANTKELRELQDFIRNNPDKYNQIDAFFCVIGLGVRLKNGELIDFDKIRESYTNSSEELVSLSKIFSDRYDIPYELCCSINGGHWHEVGPFSDTWISATPEDAINLLEYLIQNF